MGVLPTRMMPMGVVKEVPSYPWDYRVAYFQSDGSATGFGIPAAMDLNPLIVNTDDCRYAVTSAFEYGRVVVSVPSSQSSGDKKICGREMMIGAALNGGKWRAAGIAAWPTQPTTTEVPIYSDTPTLFEWTPGYVQISVPSENKSKKTSYTAGKFAVANVWYACCWYSGNNPGAGTSGSRFYDARISVVHSTYGFAWDVVPCVKDNQPYLCDRLTGTLYGKSGTGTITLGPQVADDYDAITNP